MVLAHGDLVPLFELLVGDQGDVVVDIEVGVELVCVFFVLVFRLEELVLLQHLLLQLLVVLPLFRLGLL